MHVCWVPIDGSADRSRLEKRLGELDQEVSRLVQAIRTTDAPELATELGTVRADRERIKAELARIAQYRAPDDLEQEAERLANMIWGLGERLTDADPATLRRLLQAVVSRIVCRWEPKATPSGRTRYRLVRGQVELRACDLFGCLSGSATAG